MISLINTILNLIYPKSCVICGTNLNEAENCLCQGCFMKIALNTPPFCRKCSRRIAFSTGICGECRGKKSYLKQVWSWAVYSGVIKDCILKIKYKRQKYILKAFKKYIIDFADRYNILGDVDIIVPLPIHRIVFEERGFNQSKLIASILAEHTGKTLLEPAVKTTHTKAQHYLSKKERFENIKGVFKVLEPEGALDKNILLVDDVFTTGATMNECAKVLKESGAKKIYGFVMARGF